jgi:hypothetical protein
VALGAIVSLWPGGKANRANATGMRRESLEDELVPAVAGGAE